MKKLLAILLAVAAAMAAFADDNAVPAEQQLRAMIDGASELQITDLRVRDLAEALALLSVAKQERDHVDRSARLSMIIPGLGQYVNGDTGRALLFSAADLVVTITTAVLTYWFLPPAVQWRNLNYLQTPMVDIETRWKLLSPSELIPSMAIAASGTLLSLMIRNFASADAAELATSRINEGSIVFEPF